MQMFYNKSYFYHSFFQHMLMLSDKKSKYKTEITDEQTN